MTTQKPLSELKKRLKSKTQKELAKELNISPAYLNDILNGRRSIDSLAISKLGYEIQYKKIKNK
jgi:transcriptional regulator with XRE-family HTH domain